MLLVHFPYSLALKFSVHSTEFQWPAYGFFCFVFFVFLAQGLSLASSIHFSTYMEG